MPVGDVLARVQELQALAAQASAPAAPVPTTSVSAASAFGAALAASQLASVLGDTANDDGANLPELGVGLSSGLALQSASFPPVTLEPLPASDAGERALAIAQAEVGVTEEPPGSNDGPRIAEYRTATEGAYAGAPWCAYFVSWAAARAGAPLGEEGQGFGAVEQIEAWARRTGRFFEPGTRPQPGDLILFGGRHVGIVEAVEPDGAIRTVEGNYQQGVSRVLRSPSEATGFVRLG
jgi:cell wall-associated NlpC family hydrolase